MDRPSKAPSALGSLATLVLKVRGGWMGSSVARTMLIAGAFSGAACTDTLPPGSYGTLAVAVTGLQVSPAPPNGGTVSVTTSNVPGNVAFPVTLPSSGDTSALVPAGDYTVTYTPPSGYLLDTGEVGTKNSHVTSSQVATVSFRVALAPVPTGILKLVVSGLAVNATSGGSADVLRTDIGGQTPQQTLIPASGSVRIGVVAGTYSVTYTAPAGYTIGSGVVNPRTGLVVAANDSASASFAVSIAPAVGSLQVNVTGLTGSPADGGSAIAQRTDSAGAAITINVSAAGTGVASTVPAGRYSVTYSPPSGFSVASGVPNPDTSVVVSNNNTTTITFAVTASGAFQTPDVVNNASFEPGDSPSQWDGFTNWSGGTPSPETLDTTHAFSGKWAVKRVLPVTSGSDIGGQFAILNFKGTNAAYDRLWSRFYFYFDAAMTGTHKFHLFFGPNSTQLGGLGIQGGYINFTPLGYASGGQSEWSGQGYTLLALSGLVNGWHSIEVDYWRNGDTGGNNITSGSGEPSIAIWVDGIQLTSGVGNPPSPGYWKNGRIYVGQRTTSAQITWTEWSGVLNGTPANTVPANLWLDRIAISSLGRIGP